MGKKPIVSVIYENERISIKKAYLTQNVCYVSPVWSTGPIYGRFMGFYVNGFLSTVSLYKPLYREKTVYIKIIKRP